MRLVVLCCLCGVALADPAPKIANTYGWDTNDIPKSTCTRVAGALLTKLRTKYACEATNTSDEHGAVTECILNKANTSRYELYVKLADCKSGRQRAIDNLKSSD